ncbi:MAG: NAD(P)/FAD-dependent oxidoreductase [Polaromonas sp.]|nr:NAD(P)/FAD-dependent oxidoreductase [Polaromonas sp.]
MSETKCDSALQDASMPTLLMCLFQITRDRSWLEDPFRPKRDISIFADPSGGLPPELQKIVRDNMAVVLAELESGKRELPPLPNESQLTEMMNVCVGETVPAAYTGMAMEEMGFRPRELDWRAPSAALNAGFKVVVVGAGFSGICAGYHLKKLGIPFEIIEKNPDLGGVWLENTYPEAGVDTPNHFYSFSFAPNLDWSSNYSKRQEVWDYQRKVFNDVDLAKHTQFQVEVIGLDWDEDSARWQITTRDASGRESQRWANAVITAAGNLNRPKMATVPGLAEFKGTAWHSAQWRHDVPLEDKEVAVIGTGASAMQFLRTVAATAKKVTIFQRSPQWARPPQDYHGDTSEGTRWLLKHVPFYYGWYRFGLVWRFGDGLLPTVRRDPLWPHQERSVNSRNDRQRVQLTDYLLKALDGRSDLVEKCLPGYPPYGKRILIDNGWYDSLRRPNVELVTQAVDRVDGGEVVAADGSRYRADVILMATGFEPGKMLWSIDIRGRSGQPLKEVWGEDDPRAYLGMTVPDYPNLFVLSGPNTALAHGGSVLLVTECQMRYVTSVIREMLENQISDVEVRRDVHDEFNRRVDAEHTELVWTHPGMNNWYRNAKGRVFAPMPWRLVDYWKMTREPQLNDYHVRTAA